MKTFITLSTKKPKAPKGFEDVRFTESLVEHFLKLYTKRGDKVIDIFAGLGTALIAAEKMGRIPFGIEYDKKKVDYIRSKVKRKENVIHGDALQIHHLPKFDLCLTSPPYMPKVEKGNPLRGNARGTYKQYLLDIKAIFKRLKPFMKKNSHIVIEVSNLKHRGFTPLAWDIAQIVSNVFHFEGEVVVNWTGKRGKTGGTYGYGYDHSYCLVFKKK